MFDAEQLSYMRERRLSWRDAYDFPMSWDWWRAVCVEHGEPDPGPAEPPEHSLCELNERLALLEEKMEGLSKEELGRFHMKQVRDEIVELKQTLRFVYRRIARPVPPGRRRHPQYPKTTEV